MSAKNEDFIFAQEAQNQGYVTEAQVEEAFLLQRKMDEQLGYDERLATILVKQGWLGEEQAKRVYAIIEPEGREAQIEGFRLIHKIGRGAMGTVYKALQIDLNREVAIKILRRELRGDRTQTARLRGEAKILASLDHPNIVRAIQAGESNGFPYVVMEYVEGDTLKERIKRDGPLPEDEALKITRDLADALERARRMGVVHRDVKPGNVLLSKRTGTPKLMDLGLAKGPIDAELTQHGATVGTPQFISPEQAQDPRKASTRSDIYSLGATLYAMLTGKAPHEGATLAEIIHKVLYEQPDPIRMLNRKVSSEASYLVERMMLKASSLRYATPAEVVTDIDDLLDGRSIVPKGFEGDWDRHLGRKLRRKYLAIGATVLLVVGLGGWFVYHRAESQRLDEVAGEIRAGIERGLQTTLAADDDAKRVRQRMATLENELQRIKEFESTHGPTHHWPRKSELEEKVESFRLVAQDLEELDRFEAKLLPGLVEADRYFEALKTLDQSHRTGHLAVTRRAGELATGIRETSEQAWREAVTAHPVDAPANLAALVEAAQARQRALDRGYVHSDRAGRPLGPLREARGLSRRLTQNAQDLAKRLREIEARYSERTLEEALASEDQQAFERLSRDLDRENLDLRAAMEGPWQRLGQELGTDYVRRFLAEPGGEVSQRLQVLRRRFRTTGEAHWLAERKLVLEAQESRRFDEAYRRLEDVRLRFFRIDELRRTRDAVEQLQDEVQAAARQYSQEVQAFLAATYERLFSEMVEGDASRLAEALRKARAHPLGAERREELAPADALVELLRRIDDAALAYLRERASGKRRFATLDFRRSDGQPDPREGLRLVGVEEDPVRIVFRPSTGARGEIRAYLSDLHLMQRVQLAEQQGLMLTPRERWEVELALLPQGYLKPAAPARDIRPHVRKAERLDTQAREASWRDPLAQELGRLLDRFRAEQERRELGASDLLGAARHWDIRRSWVTAKEHAEEFFREDRRHYYTDVREGAEADVRGLIARVERHLRENEVARWMPGWRVEEFEGRTRLEADFGSDRQLEAFKHGSGRLKADEGAVVTNQRVLDRALYLLEGAEQITQGRPLAIVSPFDAAMEMRMSMVVRVGRGCPFLAFDLDGVQLAIVSADPNWYDDWIVPREVREEGEDDTTVDFYGKGRGIATHHGKDFADPTSGSWDWKGESEGRWHAKWKKLGLGEKRRFALQPGRSYRIEIVRKRGILELYVDDQFILRETREIWQRMGGRRSDVPGAAMRGGSGLLQVLTWTPLVIDDLRLEGTLLEAWKKDKAEEEADRKASKDN